MPKQNAYLQTFTVALAGLSLLWLSFPPVGAWWLAWLAPIPLIWMIAMERFPVKAVMADRGPTANRRYELAEVPVTLSSQGHYWMLYLAGLAYWLGTFYFIPFPHPALWFGWLAISLYMAVYTPLFIGVSRILLHRYRVPIVLVVPAVGTGLEWFRSVFLTGMPMVCLSHTQYRQTSLIQVADLCGAYTLTFAIYLVATGIAVASLRLANRFLAGAADQSPFRFRPIGHLLMAVAVGVAVGSYGQIRLSMIATRSQESLQVALIQSSIDVLFEPLSSEQQYERNLHYWQLTQQALQQWPELDLVVWPESSYPGYDLLSDFEGQLPYTEADSAADMARFWSQVTQDRAITLLVGGTSTDPKQQTNYNSAILVQPPGRVGGRYFKNHRVVFGEYVPLADRIPLLQQTPLGRGINAGNRFEAFEVKGIRIAPCICFESAVPQLVRRMVRALNDRNQSPDVLINQTNDGWFFGSSCLDLHLACNVFRAVEMRKPMLVCANTGFSAEIDLWGRLKQVGPRQQPGLLRAEVYRSSGISSPYLWLGDILPLVAGVGSILVLLAELLPRKVAR